MNAPVVRGAGRFGVRPRLVAKSHVRSAPVNVATMPCGPSHNAHPGSDAARVGVPLPLELGVNPGPGVAVGLWSPQGNACIPYDTSATQGERCGGGVGLPRWVCRAGATSSQESCSAFCRRIGGRRRHSARGFRALQAQPVRPAKPSRLFSDSVELDIPVDPYHDLLAQPRARSSSVDIHIGGRYASYPVSPVLTSVSTASRTQPRSASVASLRSTGPTSLHSTVPWL